MTTSEESPLSLPTDPTPPTLHPLLQKEDSRRSNRRRRWKEGATPDALDSSTNLDSSSSRAELSSEYLVKSPSSLTDMSRKLSKMQASLDTVQCSEQFLKEENSKLIERLAVAKASSLNMDWSVRADTSSRDVSFGEGKRARDDLRLARARNGYLESELETCKLKLSQSETRKEEAKSEAADFHKKLKQNETEMSALRSRESEVTRLLTDPETDRRNLERIAESSRSLDQLRQRANELELENVSLLDRAETAERGQREMERGQRELEREQRELERGQRELERGHRELEREGKGGTERVKQLEDKIVGLEAELIKTKAESLINEKRLAGIDKAKEVELNYLKDQVNTKDQLLACKALEVEGVRKESNSCKQEVRGMAVALEIKEFELEQLREFKILSAQAGGSKQLTGMKETLADIQNKYQELVNQTEAERKENESKQESQTSQILELKKSRKSLIKQLKQLEQLYTVKESTHSSIEGEFSKLSKLFYALKEKNLLPDSNEVQSVLESIYQPSVSKLDELSSIHMDPEVGEFSRSGLKRSQSEGAELKSILKKSFSPRCSTPNTSVDCNPNLAYIATKHTQWLARKETSDVL